MFSNATFGADQTTTQPGFIPTFIIQGQLCLTIRSILPPYDHHYMDEPAFLQIYFKVMKHLVKKLAMKSILQH